MAGVPAVALPLLGVKDGGLDPAESEMAIAAGFLKVTNHLSSLRTIYIDSTVVTAGRSDLKSGLNPFGFKVRFWQAFETPLPLPGGSAFLKPVVLPYRGIPADHAALINPAFKTDPASTYLPAIAFVALMLMVPLFGLRGAKSQRTASTRGMLFGFVAAAMFVCGVFVLKSFWRWWPDSAISSEPSLIFLALVAGAIDGGLFFSFRAEAISSDPTIVGKDPILRSVLHSDVPIENVSADRLGFVTLVDALRRFLDNPATAPPVVLSVNGPWGSGKSSIMKMLAAELRKTGRFRIVWFNAWQYQKEQQILAAFLQTITRQLSAQSGFVFRARLAWARWKKFGPVQRAVFLTPLGIAIAAYFAPKELWAQVGGKEAPALTTAAVGTLSFGAWLLWIWNNSTPFRTQFQKLFEVKDQSRKVGFIDEFAAEFRLYREAAGFKKFLFCIDDLDRCAPDRVVEVLKAINLIIASGDETDRSFFVLGYDQDTS